MDMDIYLIRSTLTGQWLGKDGWMEFPTDALIWSEEIGFNIGPATNTQFVRFCECPL
jgi:hypothetical protein